MAAERKPAKIKARIKRTVWEIADVSLDTDGDVIEIDRREEVDASESDIIETIFVYEYHGEE